MSEKVEQNDKGQINIVKTKMGQAKLGEIDDILPNWWGYLGRSMKMLGTTGFAPAMGILGTGATFGGVIGLMTAGSALVVIAVISLVLAAIWAIGWLVIYFLIGGIVASIIAAKRFSPLIEVDGISNWVLRIMISFLRSWEYVFEGKLGSIVGRIGH